MAKTKTVVDLRKDILKIVDTLNSGETEIKTATEINGAVRNIVNMTSLQLKYSALRKEKPSIDFLDA